MARRIATEPFLCLALALCLGNAVRAADPDEKARVREAGERVAKLADLFTWKC